jgi:hypothetical protein
MIQCEDKINAISKAKREREKRERTQETIITVMSVGKNLCKKQVRLKG